MTLADILAKQQAARNSRIAQEKSLKADDTGQVKSPREEAASSPGGTGGIRITQESEKARLAAMIKSTFDATAPKFPPPVPMERELGDAKAAGEQIPMDHPPADASEAARAWFDCLHSFESALGVVVEPDPSPWVWLAVADTRNPQARPILIHRLPLLNPEHRNVPF